MPSKDWASPKVKHEYASRGTSASPEYGSIGDLAFRFKHSVRRALTGTLRRLHGALAYFMVSTSADVGLMMDGGSCERR